jgi:hypothetical protein
MTIIELGAAHEGLTRGFVVKARLLGTAALLCVSATAANAMTWRFQNAFLNGPDAGALTGSFDYNSVTNTISNINLTLSGLKFYNPIYNQHTEVSFTGLTGCNVPGCQSNVEFVSHASGAWLDLYFTPYLSHSGGACEYTAHHQLPFRQQRLLSIPQKKVKKLELRCLLT